MCEIRKFPLLKIRFVQHINSNHFYLILVLLKKLNKIFLCIPWYQKLRRCPWKVWNILRYIHFKDLLRFLHQEYQTSYLFGQKIISNFFISKFIIIDCTTTSSSTSSRSFGSWSQRIIIWCINLGYRCWFIIIERFFIFLQ